MESVKKFLAITIDHGDGSGYGYGDGSGYGYVYGDVYGDGSGDGSGYGYGYGDGDGYGDGYGYGDGLKSFNNKPVYLIDNVQTLIDSIKGNIAKGSIINDDFTLTPCYIAKYENYFAHGKTIKKAYADAQHKAFNNMPVEKRIELFCEKFNYFLPYKASEFFEWHGILTGSCNFGRESFCRNKEIDLNSDMNVFDFIRYTEYEYNGHVIKQLKERYERE